MDNVGLIGVHCGGQDQSLLFGERNAFAITQIHGLEVLFTTAATHGKPNGQNVPGSGVIFQ